jgi:glycosyltransferase involved in cell wall biosynthesis
MLTEKEKAYKCGNMVVVSPSVWMDNNVKESYALNGKRHYIIPNPINVDIFRPLDRKEIRKKYGVNGSRHIIVFGAVGVSSSPYKGYNELLRCLDIFSRKYRDFGEVDVYVFGSSGESKNYNDQITINYLGYLDEEKMVEAYNLADVYVVSSLEDSFNNTVAESMSTETPVVAFAVGGIVDIINHKENGYLAEAIEPEDLADGIFWVLNNNQGNELGRNGRKKVIENFSYSIVAKKYYQLMSNLLSE